MSWGFVKGFVFSPLAVCSRREKDAGRTFSPRLVQVLVRPYFRTTVLATMGMESWGRAFCVTNRPGAA
jgi:hypothetical protein